MAQGNMVLQGIAGFELSATESANVFNSLNMRFSVLLYVRFGFCHFTTLQTLPGVTIMGHQ